MRILRACLVELHKIFTSKGFYACVGLTFILCLTATMYYDPTSDSQYSVIQSFLDFDREFKLSNTSFCSQSFIIDFSGTYFSMFAPIVTAFAFVPLYCDEREYKFVRYSIFRKSRLSHNLSRFLSAAVSGGLAVCMGFVLFAAVVLIIFPSAAEYSADMQMQIQMLTNGEDYTLKILLKFACTFIYGIVSALPAFLLTGFMRNKYLILCIPFFLKYAACRGLSMVTSDIFSSQNPNYDLYNLTQIIDPNGSLKVFFAADNMLYILLYCLALCVITLIAHHILADRRTDCGS